jgi:hypothetical protein
MAQTYIEPTFVNLLSIPYPDDLLTFLSTLYGVNITRLKATAWTLHKADRPERNHPLFEQWNEARLGDGAWFFLDKWDRLKLRKVAEGLTVPDSPNLVQARSVVRQQIQLRHADRYQGLTWYNNNLRDLVTGLVW